MSFAISLRVQWKTLFSVAIILLSFSARADIDDLDANFAMRKPEDTRLPVFGRISATELMGIEARDGSVTNVRAQVDYNFYQTYSFGVHTSYRWPYGEEDPGYNGWGDVSFVLADQHLYESKPDKFSVSGDLTYVMPQSRRSQSQSLDNAVQAGVRMRKGLGRFSFVYRSEFGRYFYEYDTVNENSSVYNSAYAWNNSLSVIYRYTRTLSSSLSGSLKTAVDYNNQVNNTSKFDADFTVDWKATPDVTLTTGVKSTTGGQGGAGGDSSGGTDTTTQTPGAGPRSNNLFDSATTAFEFAVAYKF